MDDCSSPCWCGLWAELRGPPGAEGVGQVSLDHCSGGKNPTLQGQGTQGQVDSLPQ